MLLNRSQSGYVMTNLGQCYKLVEFVMSVTTVEIWLKIWKLINMLVTFIYASGSGKGYISEPIFVTHVNFYLLLHTNYSRTCICLGF